MAFVPKQPLSYFNEINCYALAALPSRKIDDYIQVVVIILCIWLDWAIQFVPEGFAPQPICVLGSLKNFRLKKISKNNALEILLNLILQ